MTPVLTLEPLSRAHLPEAEALWADPAVIRYTNIAAPCTASEAAERLDRLLDFQRGLPAPTIFAVREGAAFRAWPAVRRWTRPPGRMGCSISCCLSAGDGAWVLPPPGRRCGVWKS